MDGNRKSNVSFLFFGVVLLLTTDRKKLLLITVVRPYKRDGVKTLQKGKNLISGCRSSLRPETSVLKFPISFLLLLTASVNISLRSKCDTKEALGWSKFNKIKFVVNGDIREAKFNIIMKDFLTRVLEIQPSFNHVSKQCLVETNDVVVVVWDIFMNKCFPKSVTIVNIE